MSQDSMSTVGKGKRAPITPTQPPILTPLTKSVLVGLFDEAAVEAAVVATGATIGVDIGLEVTVEPSLLVVDIAGVSLENVTTAADEVWIEVGPVRET